MDRDPVVHCDLGIVKGKHFCEYGSKRCQNRVESLPSYCYKEERLYLPQQIPQ